MSETQNQDPNGNQPDPAMVAASATPTLEDRLSATDRRMEELAQMNRAILAKMDNLSRPTPAKVDPPNLSVPMEDWIKDPNGQIERVVQARLKETMKPFEDWMVEDRKARKLEAVKNDLEARFGDKFNEIKGTFFQVLGTASEITPEAALQAYYISRGALESGAVSRPNGSPVQNQPVNGPGVRSGITPPATPSSPPTPLPANGKQPIQLSEHEEFLRRQQERKTGKAVSPEEFVKLRDEGMARDGVSGNFVVDTANLPKMEPIQLGRR